MQKTKEIIEYYGAFVEDTVPDKEINVKKQEEVKSCRQHLN